MNLGRSSGGTDGISVSIQEHFGGRSRTIMSLAFLAAAAYFYYGFFYNYSFNLADEGSVALIAEKLANGERPYVDIEIGYGIFWYLPIAFLFKVLGVKLYVLKIYFLVIAFASGVIAYALLLRLTASHALSLATALIVLAFPGWSYQPYIPFLVISGLYVLSLYDQRTLEPTIPAALALLCNGLFLGLAFLIRGDIATVFAFVFIFYHGLIVSRKAMSECRWGRLLEVPFRVLVVGSVVALVALPFAVEAKAGGYLEGFMGQYTAFGESLFLKLQQRFFLAESSAPALAAGSLLPRVELLTLILGSDDPKMDRGFAFLTYAPVGALFTILALLIVDFGSGQVSVQRVSAFIGERAYLLAMTVGAFSTFPQFFVWRPDMPHLVGFMPGFVVLMSYLFYTLRADPDPLRRFGDARKAVFYSFCGFCSVYLLLFATHSEDGLKLRQYRTSRLVMDKGIDIYLHKGEVQQILQLNSIIREVSQPGEFVLCFPYCPGINFFADRPTFQRNLYVDDSMLTSRPAWVDEMRSEVARRKPKVIVVQDWAINATEISRFRNWAGPLYHDITEGYDLKAKVYNFDVFVLK